MLMNLNRTLIAVLIVATQLASGAYAEASFEVRISSDGEEHRKVAPSSKRGSSFQKKDIIAFYSKGLDMPSEEVVSACIGALGKYKEGYDILYSFVEERYAERYAARAIRTLRAYDIDLKRGKELFHLYRKVKEEENISYSRNTSSELLLLLGDKFPERFKYHLLKHAVQSLRERPDLSDQTRIKSLKSLIASLPKEDVYRLVPELCRSLEKTWSPRREDINSLLKMTTGLTVELRRNDPVEKLAEAVEKYREFYYTKLKQHIPEMDDKLLKEPFGDIGKGN